MSISGNPQISPLPASPVQGKGSSASSPMSPSPRASRPRSASAAVRALSAVDSSAPSGRVTHSFFASDPSILCAGPPEVVQSALVTAGRGLLTLSLSLQGLASTSAAAMRRHQQVSRLVADARAKDGPESVTLSLADMVMNRVGEVAILVLGRDAPHPASSISQVPTARPSSALPAALPSTAGQAAPPTASAIGTWVSTVTALAEAVTRERKLRIAFEAERDKVMCEVSRAHPRPGGEPASDTADHDAVAALQYENLRLRQELLAARSGKISSKRASRGQRGRKENTSSIELPSHHSSPASSASSRSASPSSQTTLSSQDGGPSLDIRASRAASVPPPEDLEAALVHWQKSSDAHKKEADVLRRRLMVSESELDMARQNVTRLQNELTEAKLARDRLEASRPPLHKNITEWCAEQDARRVKAELERDSVVSFMAGQAEEVRLLRVQLDRAKLVNERLGIDYKALTGVANEAIGERAVLEEETRTAHIIADSLKRQAEIAEFQSDEARRANFQLKNQERRANDVRAEMEKQLFVALDELSVVKQQLQSARTNELVLGQRVSDLSDHADKLAVDHLFYKTEFERMNNAKREWDESLKAAGQSILRVRAESREIKAAATEAISEAAVHRIANMNLQREIEALKERVQSLNSRNESLLANMERAAQAREQRERLAEQAAEAAQKSNQGKDKATQTVSKAAQMAISDPLGLGGITGAGQSSASAIGGSGEGGSYTGGGDLTGGIPEGFVPILELKIAIDEAVEEARKAWYRDMRKAASDEKGGKAAQNSLHLKLAEHKARTYEVELADTKEKLVALHKRVEKAETHARKKDDAVQQARQELGDTKHALLKFEKVFKAVDNHRMILILHIGALERMMRSAGLKAIPPRPKELDLSGIGDKTMSGDQPMYTFMGIDLSSVKAEEEAMAAVVSLMAHREEQEELHAASVQQRQQSKLPGHGDISREGSGTTIAAQAGKEASADIIGSGSVLAPTEISKSASETRVLPTTPSAPLPATIIPSPRPEADGAGPRREILKSPSFAFSQQRRPMSASGASHPRPSEAVSPAVVVPGSLRYVSDEAGRDAISISGSKDGLGVVGRQLLSVESIPAAAGGTNSPSRSGDGVGGSGLLSPAASVSSTLDKSSTTHRASSASPGVRPPSSSQGKLGSISAAGRRGVVVPHHMASVVVTPAASAAMVETIKQHFPELRNPVNDRWQERIKRITSQQRNSAGSSGSTATFFEERRLWELHLNEQLRVASDLDDRLRVASTVAEWASVEAILDELRLGTESLVQERPKTLDTASLESLSALKEFIESTTRMLEPESTPRSDPIAVHNSVENGAGKEESEDFDSVHVIPFSELEPNL